MQISINVLDIVLLSLALQGLVLSVLIFKSSKKIKSNKWLAAFIFVLSYSTLGTVALNSILPAKFPYIYFLLPQLRLTLGPILFFYTISLLNGPKAVIRKDYFHFLTVLFDWGPQISFLFHFTGLLSIVAISNWYLPFEKQIFSFESGPSGNLFFFISFVSYSVVCYKMVFQDIPDSERPVQKRTDINWLKTLLHSVFGLIAIWVVAILFNYLPKPQYDGPIRYLMVLLAISFTYWLGMSAYMRQSKMSETDVLSYNKTPAKIELSEAEISAYHKRLDFVMCEKQIYLNPALKLTALAQELAMPEKALSAFLNQCIGKNFNDFVNEYRVEEAKIKLADPASRQFTIAAIAFDCGFNSLATFQRCFKQFTGITPSDFQHNLKAIITS